MLYKCHQHCSKCLKLGRMLHAKGMSIISTGVRQLDSVISGTTTYCRVIVTTCMTKLNGDMANVKVFNKNDASYIFCRCYSKTVHLYIMAFSV